MIGLLGGTFDPVHHGHLRIALEVKEALGLSEVRFIPCRCPPHRGEPAADAEQRLAMLRLAIADVSGFGLDTRELERPGPSYMIDTLASLRAELADAPLCLILGWDAFLGLPRWRCWQDLTDYAHLAVVRRSPLDDDADRFRNADDALNAFVAARRCAAERLSGASAGGIAFLETPLLDVSASRIRALLRSGRDPRYLLPENVLEFIRRTGLYLS